MIAEVIVDIAHSEVDKIFEYICDDSVECGSRVIVPFGKMKIEGIVVSLKEKSRYPSDKLKSVVRVVDSFPAITKEHISLMDYMRKKYHITMALILRLFLPSEMRKGKVREKLISFAVLNTDYTYEQACSKISLRSNKQIQILDFMSNVKKCKIAELKRDFGNYSVNALLACEVLKTVEERELRSPYTALESTEKNYSLTSEQERTLKSILDTDKTVTLVFGVTGSGKTAVYIELIKNTVRQGKTAIMLVPEIALTPQMLSQLSSCFGDECAILHSGLSQGERFDEWYRLRSGEAKIAIGARSAVFAPLENLGLIIIDEEHEGSYESESNPRYSTIDIAKFRARYNGCKLILGSATPSVDSFMRAKSGEYNLCEMPTRINKRPMPEMLIADMRNELMNGNNTAFSSVLKAEIEDCLKAENQAIIFINRRGYSQQVICRECGYVAKCENCDVSLNYHSSGNVLKCHYCGATYKMLTACPECGGVHLNYIGTGTQKVVEDLKKLFPKAAILRMDNDTTQNKEGHFKILKQFAEHKADILVGTQMIAKGHDFPSVTLVGILDADMSLFFSDYRSGERTFQLLTQVAGRAGRADKKGVVVLQTYAPKNAVLKLASTYNYTGFFEREQALRKATHFPPFAVILRVMVESEDDELALDTLRKIYEEISPIYEAEREKFLFFNKMKSPIKRLKNKFRYQLLMRIKIGEDELIDKIYEISLKYVTNKVLVYVENNPSNLS
ncbi:MAG: primosomal protein N' [Christensenellaceae bacterium]